MSPTMKDALRRRRTTIEKHKPHIFKEQGTWWVMYQPNTWRVAVRVDSLTSLRRHDRLVSGAPYS